MHYFLIYLIWLENAKTSLYFRTSEVSTGLSTESNHMENKAQTKYALGQYKSAAIRS